jgi:hypothetical protein
MAEIQKEPANRATKAKSSINWPPLAAGVLCVAFIVGVWVNNYRVSHAAVDPAPVTTTK